MPRRVVLTCISPALKKILQAETHHVTDTTVRQAFEVLLNETPECKNGGVLGLEIDNGEIKTEHAKRAPSEYNRFIGSCIKARLNSQPVPEAMKGCARKWRERKR